jgi:Response regulator containing a CheY-like receiver domain and an HD-GYP domain
MTDRVTILTVDDQPTNLRLLEAVLSPQGYRVITASSGEQALELLHSSNIDLVLLDIMMPGIDGYEVCHGSGASRVRSFSRSS